METKKTKEEILKKHCGDWSVSVEEAMQEHTDQETLHLTERIKQFEEENAQLLFDTMKDESIGFQAEIVDLKNKLISKDVEIKHLKTEKLESIRFQKESRRRKKEVLRKYKSQLTAKDKEIEGLKQSVKAQRSNAEWWKKQYEESILSMSTVQSLLSESEARVKELKDGIYKICNPESTLADVFETASNLQQLLKQNDRSAN